MAVIEVMQERTSDADIKRRDKEFALLQRPHRVHQATFGTALYSLLVLKSLKELPACSPV